MSGAGPEPSPLPLDAIQIHVASEFGLFGAWSELPGEVDRNLRLDTGDGRAFVVRISPAGADLANVAFQHAALVHVARLGLCPRAVTARDGAGWSVLDDDAGRARAVRVIELLPGTPVAALDAIDDDLRREWGRSVARLAVALQDFVHPAMHRKVRWDLARAAWIVGQDAVPADRRALLEPFVLQFLAEVQPCLDTLPRGVIHNDGNDHNVLVAPGPGGRWQVTGIVDFGDMVHTCSVFDVAIAGAYAALHAGDPLAALAALTAGYHEVRPLSEAEVDVVFAAMCMRLCVSVTTSTLAAVAEPDNPYLLVSQAPALALLERLRGIAPGAATERLRAACGLPERPQGRPIAELKRARERHLGGALRLSYAEPLKIVRGRGAWLFDAAGRGCLDCVNNVSHVGHAHPRVVAAACGQMAVLNTNTRYLHDGVVAYAERLAALFPDPLQVCFFVCSGSEANELALRLARAHTGREDVVVLDAAYHGNTSALIGLSPYKHDGPGGRGRPAGVHVAELPDPYRGAHRRGGGDGLAQQFAESVRASLAAAEQSGGAAAFFAESMAGCAGQVEYPAGYLERAHAHARAAGAVCVADEVQVGFGRVGSHWWAFETQGVVPDIVTLGKPIGNGHPLAAVVTTPEIAASFANGMEYFNTFGGNPVSAAVGMAVLDVIEAEGLMQRALRVGALVKVGLQELRERFPVLGDVRGQGLFLGAEFVRDRATLEPAAEELWAVVEGMRAAGFLLSADGPHHNVLKFKPPMVFSELDATMLLGALERVLRDVVGGG